MKRKVVTTESLVRDMERIIENIEEDRVNIEQVKSTLKCMVEEYKEDYL